MPTEYKARDIYELTVMYQGFFITGKYIPAYGPSGARPDEVAVQVAVQTAVSVGLKASDFKSLHEPTE